MLCDPALTAIPLPDALKWAIYSHEARHRRGQVGCFCQYRTFAPPHANVVVWSTADGRYARTFRQPFRNGEATNPCAFWSCYENFISLIFDTSVLSSGEVFASLYPSDRPIVGGAPSSGRLVTVDGSRLRA